MAPEPDRTNGASTHAPRTEAAADPAPGATDPAAGALQVLTGRMVSLRFVMAALRRARRLWLAAGVVGLLAGAGYHLVVPVKYSATATLYLAHPAGSASTVEAQNDLAIVKTATVANRAIARLGPAGKGLTPSGLLGKAPATITSGNVMTLTVSGPSSSSAVQRVNALAAAYLGFRAQIYEQQNRSVVAAADRQISNLDARITDLSSQITTLATTRGSSQQVANLEAQRASATSSLLSLQQSVQQQDLDTISVVHGSRVITPGTPVPTSRKKVLAVDGLTGMAGGLGAAVVVVIALACLSDRLHRREDVASLVGAPVGLSIGPLRRGFLRRRSIRAMASRRQPRLLALVHHYKELLGQSPRRTLTVVTADDPSETAAALLVAADTLAAQGSYVVVVDETPERALGRAFGAKVPGIRPVHVRDGESVTLLVPPKPWEAGGDADVTDDAARADVVLVVAGIDPGAGAAHLRRWTSHAVLSVTAGKATTRGVAALVELLDAAGIDVPSAVLLDADVDDESAGLPVVASAGIERRLGPLAPAPLVAE